MKYYFLLFVGLFLTFDSSAQPKEQLTTTVKKVTDINEVLSDSRFLFTEYSDAGFFTNRGSGQAKMNYNMLTGEMMFINQSGDTLALMNPKDISSIRFGKREFIYASKKYFEVLKTDGDKALLLHRQIKPAKVTQRGAYGITTPSASIKNISSIDDVGVYDDKLAIHKDILYEVSCTFFLQSGESIYTGATEKNFVKVFGKEKKEAISTFINENKLDLEKEQDLLQLFNFCIENSR